MIIAIAVVVALIVKAFVLQAFYIPSPSMEPTLKKDDRVLVNKLSYKFGKIGRGDVIVFERPPGEANLALKDLIKRVIGLPGDTVEARDDRVYVNGKPLKEPYVPEGMPTQCFPQPIVVPAGQLLVLGDNRIQSEDGRFFGTFDEHLVVGRAFLQVWPIPSIELL